MNSKKKAAAIIVVILLAVLILFRIFGGKETEIVYESRPTVAVAQPGTGDIVLYTDMIGTVEPVSRADVMPKISGEVLEVNFQAGDHVEAGQVLCRIDSDAITSLRISMETAQVALNQANSQLSRNQSLYASGYISQEAWEQLQNAAENARLSYEAAKNQYDLQVEYTTITAPISGVVESRNVEVHDNVNTSTVLCAISSSGQYQVTFGISDTTLDNLKVGDTITADKNGQKYEGTVTEIGSMVDASTGLYDAKAEIPQMGSLTTGSRVKLTMVRDQALGAMTVPVDCVNYDDGQPFVYVYDNGTARRVDIETGIYDSENMEVLSGLTADSQVIVTWSNELADGAEVLLKEEDQEGAQEETVQEETAQEETAGEAN